MLKEGKASGKWRDNGGGGGGGRRSGVARRVAPILSPSGCGIIRLRMREVTVTSSWQHEDHGIGKIVVQCLVFEMSARTAM